MALTVRGANNGKRFDAGTLERDACGMVALDIGPRRHRSHHQTMKHDGSLATACESQLNLQRKGPRPRLFTISFNEVF